MKENKKRLIIVTGILIALVILVLFFIRNNETIKSTAPTLLASGETAEIGGEAYVTVSVENNPGMAGFVLDLVYDSEKLAPLEVIQGNILSEGLFNSNLDMQADENIIKVTWFDVADMMENGDLYTVKFKVLSTTKEKVPVTLSYTEGNIANQALELVAFDTKDANITIKN